MTKHLFKKGKTEIPNTAILGCKFLVTGFQIIL